MILQPITMCYVFWSVGQICY